MTEDDIRRQAIPLLIWFRSVLEFPSRFSDDEIAAAQQIYKGLLYPEPQPEPTIAAHGGAYDVQRLTTPFAD